MATFTVFCRAVGEKTTYITPIETDNMLDAGWHGRYDCAQAWDISMDLVMVLGVAEGNVNILEWDDEVIE